MQPETISSHPIASYLRCLRNIEYLVVIVLKPKCLVSSLSRLINFRYFNSIYSGLRLNLVSSEVNGVVSVNMHFRPLVLT